MMDQRMKGSKFNDTAFLFPEPMVDFIIESSLITIPEVRDQFGKMLKKPGIRQPYNDEVFRLVLQTSGLN